MNSTENNGEYSRDNDDLVPVTIRLSPELLETITAMAHLQDMGLEQYIALGMAEVAEYDKVTLSY